ncbi:GH36-type glycosyl hydrolase domain-containing protein [Oenococcus sicerae]|uniref:GH36-type glycosyl hydrolase domain-containing protein n=1 Tax=Oenococcus sicerae TaxID=2203724 RepID=UPI0010B53926|nr:1,2-beta-oligoglucan phosphorylase {ECO:0000305} [Oenococcus sicerae]
MHSLKNDHLQINFLPNGSIEKIISDGIMINQVDGNLIDGSLANIYLRNSENGKYRDTKLIGPESNSEFSLTEHAAKWSGEFDGISYIVTLYLGDQKWFWNIDLTSDSDNSKQTDIFYTQDLGLGLPSFVSSNEAYASQYIDHHIEKKAGKISISSRQNQSQDGRFPYLQQGAFNPLQSYATDGFQFFGKSYKATGVPESLTKAQLPNYNYQYEFSLIALQTMPLKMTNRVENIVFYAAFQGNDDSDNQQPYFSENDLSIEFMTLKNSYDEESFKSLSVAHKKESISSLPLDSSSFSEEEIDELFPKRIQEEYQNGKLLSFFLQDGSHAVLKAKEVLQERATGNIIMASSTSTPATRVLATTQFMMGIFASQTVFGNTNMNKFSANLRNPLNVLKMQGMHLYLRQADHYILLGLPSIFVMSYNASDWYYKLADDLIKISVDAFAEKPFISFVFTSMQHKKYDLIITDQIIMDSQDSHDPLQTKKVNHSIIFYPNATSLMRERNPNIRFAMNYENTDATDISLGDETDLLETVPVGFQAKMFTINYRGASQLSINLTVSNQEDFQQLDCSATESRIQHQKAIEKLIHGFELSAADCKFDDQLQRTNLIVRWFAHDALVHLLSPHGLEQYGGAAWGTRDVSQGPTEFFLATQNYDQVKRIIEILYSHQFIESGNWPQWFMFDEYADQFADESHGDIIIWPLKVVADYIRLSGDRDILNTELPYMNFADKKETKQTESLLKHIKRQVSYIENNFLYDTNVSAYGDGDWDDTLQPADAKQKKIMASTWTEELTIQVLEAAAESFQGLPLAAELSELSTRMLADFKKYFMQSKTLPGFIRMYPDHHTDNIIYPGDKITGIDYRLIPLTRGIISGIFDTGQSQTTLKTIKDHLLFPDGVRLMNRPAHYRGGISHVFKRAEQAANFGREIGLMYTHAHIRYAAALAIAGDSDAWQALQLVNPINLNKFVHNANIRQSNVYFSSSDAAFNNRYEAEAQFEKVHTGQIVVKGGWRLYSSGPGIYIGELLSKVIGLIPDAKTLRIKAVLPLEMIDSSQLFLRYEFKGQNLKIHFRNDGSANID